MKTARPLLLLVLLLVAVSIFAVAFGCGDNDDDDDDDFDAGDDDAASGDDDDQAVGDCGDYANEFFGENGCFPDQTLYESTLVLCVQLENQGVDTGNTFFACLAEIDCAQYADPLDLDTALQECLTLLPGF